MTKIKVICASCRTLLLRYDKRGSGALVKLNPDRVLKDYCSENPLDCPNASCGTIFARYKNINGTIFRQLLGGKVTVKGGGISAR